MANDTNGLRKLGATGFLMAAACFLATEVFALLAGPPPADGGEILRWVAAGRGSLSMIAELLFVGSTALVPAAFALHAALAPSARARATFGCAMLGLITPLLWATLVAQGRLVYPQFGIRLHAPDVAELLVALYYGGRHVASLLFAFALGVLAHAMWRGRFSRPVAAVGVLAAATQVAAGYPDLIGPLPTLACGVVFAAWLTAVGVKLWGVRAPARS